MQRTTKTKEMKTITFALPTELHKRLKIEAARQETPMAFLMIEYLEKGLAGKEVKLNKT